MATGIRAPMGPLLGKIQAQNTDWWDSNAPPGYAEWSQQERSLGTRTPNGYQPRDQYPMAGPLPGGAGGPVGPAQTGSGNGYPLVPGGSAPLLQPWSTPFQAPGGAGMELDPGYRFAVDEGNQAIQRSAAARGTLLTGGTLKELGRYNAGMAAQQYGDIYNRASNNYDRNRDIFQSNQDRPYNKLMGLSDAGQRSAESVGNAGSSYAGNASNLLTGQGNVNAAGRVGSANAWGGAINDISQNAMLAYLLRQQRGTPPYAGYPRY